MCLVTTQLEPKIADKDIICYKLVERTKIKGIYKSHFLEFEYIIRRLYKNYFDIKYADMLIKRRYRQFAIEEGMFHSYTSSIYPMLSPSPYYALLKCIIPKGAYYYEGYFYDLPSYASSQIKILEEIKYGKII